MFVVLAVGKWGKWVVVAVVVVVVAVMVIAVAGFVTSLASRASHHGIVRAAFLSSHTAHRRGRQWRGAAPRAPPSPFTTAPRECSGACGSNAPRAGACGADAPRAAGTRGTTALCDPRRRTPGPSLRRPLRLLLLHTLQGGGRCVDQWVAQVCRGVVLDPRARATGPSRAALGGRTSTWRERPSCACLSVLLLQQDRPWHFRPWMVHGSSRTMAMV